ncbi:MAG: hypothetical protein IPL90_19190 [Holophagales bacterium]|nr:hypothetical protein [Holophagales bacterium]
MHPFKLRHIMGIALAGLLLLASAAQAQVNLLWYKEVAKEGRIYVFNDPNKFQAFELSGEMGISLTRVNFGPAGETVVFDNEAALDLYNFKHNRDAEVRPYKAPKAPTFPPPTTLKVADGELKFGLLLQAWYIMDDSAPLHRLELLRQPDRRQRPSASAARRSSSPARSPRTGDSRSCSTRPRGSARRRPGPTARSSRTWRSATSA